MSSSSASRTRSRRARCPRSSGRAPRIINLSGDFRLRSAAEYEKYYGAVHPAPQLLAESVYGLPETNKDAIRDAKLIASPGCFATAITLGLLPLAKVGLLEGGVEVVGITGSSGSGVAPSAGTHHPVRAMNLRTYKPLSHQHLPEIHQTLTQAGATALSLHFVPVSAPLTRGIFATSFVKVDAHMTKERIAEAFHKAFEGARFVRVPQKRLPEVVAVSGSNYAEVGFELGPVEGNERTVACFSAIDNLIKGGAGQAVQSMNITLGLDEDTTLADAGGYP
ncbi:MAG: N-acetyl-gamma-glutamyl-phosphate reductase [Minicystis sp.]